MTNEKIFFDNLKKLGLTDKDFNSVVQLYSEIFKKDTNNHDFMINNPCRCGTKVWDYDKVDLKYKIPEDIIAQVEQFAKEHHLDMHKAVYNNDLPAFFLAVPQKHEHFTVDYNVDVNKVNAFMRNLGFINRPPFDVWDEDTDIYTVYYDIYYYVYVG